MRSRTLAVLALQLLAGCGDERTGEPAASASARDRAPYPGTARMASELDSIYRAALDDPMRYGHLNRERARLWRTELDRTRGPARSRARLYYAYESLAAGDTEAAIREVERLLEDSGLAREVSSRSKPLFDLLALAYLRLGEQRNRAWHRSAGASILPLAPDAIDADPAATRRAISLYGLILDAYPEDLQARWLMNLGYVAVGAYPDSVPPEHLIPWLGPETGGRVPRFPNLAPALGVDVDAIAGAVSLEDFDGDGFIDILATARGFDDQVRLFLADGRGGFDEHTSAAGLTGLVGGLNAVHADYDNDGFDDVLLLRGAWLAADGAHPNSLLRNRGDGTFEDVTAGAGLLSRRPTQTAAWGDFNVDGHVDLFVGNETGPTGGGEGHSELWLNRGDGTFAEVSRQVGIDLRAFVKAVAWGDVDNDGLPDLYVSVLDEPNRLYLNRGGTTPEDWRFEEAGAAAGVEEPLRSFPVLFWDFDNDGWEDLFVAAFDPTLAATAPGETASQLLGRGTRAHVNRLYRNDGDGTFTDVAPEVGLDLSLWAMGINFGDLDNDGYLDLYVGTGTPDPSSIMPNRMFLSEGASRFRDISLEGGFGHLQKGHAIGFADFDRDGDQDIYAVMGGAMQGDHFPNALFENPGFGEGHAWVTLDLEGRAANRSAIGARIRVTVTAPDGERRSIHRTVSTGGTFGASSLRQVIGLGPTSRIEELRIVWPDRDRSTDVHAELPVNAHYRVVQGGGARPVAAEPVVMRRR